MPVGSSQSGPRGSSAVHRRISMDALLLQIKASSLAGGPIAHSGIGSGSAWFWSHGFRKHSLLERNCWIGQTPIVTLTAQMETLKPLVCGLAIILAGHIGAAPYQGFFPEAATNKNGSQAPRSPSKPSDNPSKLEWFLKFELSEQVMSMKRYFASN